MSLTVCVFIYIVSSQTLPGHLQDPLNLSTHGGPTLEEDGNDEARWSHSNRLAAHSNTAVIGASSLSRAHSRDSSVDKHFVSPPPPVPPLNLNSPRLHGSHSRRATGGAADRPPEVKNANYTHHRQASIIHGIQHSRNGSVASSAASPLSPQMIAAVGTGIDRPDMQSTGRMDEAASPVPPTPNTAAGNSSGPSGFAMDRTTAKAETVGGPAQRRAELAHSKSRRDLAHTRSHSVRHRDEQKTVGEYALHVLFTSVRFPVLPIRQPS